MSSFTGTLAQIRYQKQVTDRLLAASHADQIAQQNRVHLFRQNPLTEQLETMSHVDEEDNATRLRENEFLNAYYNKSKLADANYKALDVYNKQAATFTLSTRQIAMIEAVDKKLGSRTDLNSASDCALALRQFPRVVADERQEQARAVVAPVAQAPEQQQLAASVVVQQQQDRQEGQPNERVQQLQDEKVMDFEPNPVANPELFQAPNVDVVEPMGQDDFAARNPGFGSVAARPEGDARNVQRQDALRRVLNQRRKHVLQQAISRWTTFAALRAQYDHYREEVERWQKIANEQFHLSNAQIQRYEEEIHRLQASIQKLYTQLGMLQRQVEQAQQNEAVAERECENQMQLQRDFVSSRQEFSNEMHHRMEEREQTHQHQLQQLNEAHDQSNQALNQELGRREQGLQQAQQAINVLQYQSEAQRQQGEALQGVIVQQAATIDELKRAIAQLQPGLEDAMQRLQMGAEAPQQAQDVAENQYHPPAMVIPPPPGQGPQDQPGGLDDRVNAGLHGQDPDAGMPGIRRTGAAQRGLNLIRDLVREDLQLDRKEENVPMMSASMISAPPEAEVMGNDEKQPHEPHEQKEARPHRGPFAPPDYNWPDVGPGSFVDWQAEAQRLYPRVAVEAVARRREPAGLQIKAWYELLERFGQDPEYRHWNRFIPKFKQFFPRFIDPTPERIRAANSHLTNYLDDAAHNKSPDNIHFKPLAEILAQWLQPKEAPPPKRSWLQQVMGTGDKKGGGINVGAKKPKKAKNTNDMGNPSYQPFGKYFLSMGDLDQRRVKLVYKSGIPTSFPLTNISSRVQDIIKHIVQTQSLPPNCLDSLPEKEHAFLSKLVHMCQLQEGLGMKHFIESKDQAALERMDILKSMIQEGNDAPEVLKELKQLTKHLMGKGHIKTHTGNKILAALS